MYIDSELTKDGTCDVSNLSLCCTPLL